MVSFIFPKIDAETKGVLLGMFSSIVTSITTIYITQHYIVQKAASEAIKQSQKTSQQPSPSQGSGSVKSSALSTSTFLSLSENWKPLSDHELSNMHRIIDN